MHLSRKNASHWSPSVVRPASHGTDGREGFSSSDDPEQPPPAWDVTLQSCSLAVICLLSVLGNFLVAFTLVRKEQLVLPSNRLVFNLTGANFVFSLLVLPFVVASVAEQNWLFGIFWCNFTAFFTLLVGVASILTLAMIAVDRYYAIVKPLVYTMTITTSKSTAMLLWVWIQSCVCSLPPLFGWSRFEYLETTAACTVAWGDSVSYTLFLLLFCVFAPFAVMAACYYRIFQVARAKCRKVHVVGTVGEAPSNVVQQASAAPQAPKPRQHRLPSVPKRPSWILLSHSTASKGIRTICVVLGAVLITWLPYVALAVAEVLCGGSGGTSCVQRRLQVLATWLMYSGAVCHPVVYGLYNRSIRREVKLCLCPPGSKALKGLPRRNSRRPSFTGSLLEFSPFRVRGQSRRPSTEYSRASIDLGSFALARAGDRKASQDSGAVMIESDAEGDLSFLHARWHCRRPSSRLHQFAAKFHKFRDRRSGKVHPLPILDAIDVAVEEARRTEVAAVHAEDDRLDAAAAVCFCGGKPGEAAGSREFRDIPYLGEGEFRPQADGTGDETLFATKTSHVERGESVDEGIGNDCVLQDVD